MPESSRVAKQGLRRRRPLSRSLLEISVANARNLEPRSLKVVIRSERRDIDERRPRAGVLKVNDPKGACATHEKVTSMEVPVYQGLGRAGEPVYETLNRSTQPS